MWDFVWEIEKNIMNAGGKKLELGRELRNPEELTDDKRIDSENEIERK
ncbi:hypothetical protein [Helicobacter suis]|nr:hypothetical protein [Helicobacter suis]